MHHINLSLHAVNLTLLFHAFRLQYMLATYFHVNCITMNNTEHVLTSQCSIEGMMMGENALNNPHSKLQNSRCKSDFIPLHLQCEYICPVLYWKSYNSDRGPGSGPDLLPLATIDNSMLDQSNSAGFYSLWTFLWPTENVNHPEIAALSLCTCARALKFTWSTNVFASKG